MKVHFNEDTDVLTIVLSDSPVARTVEIEYGVVDLDEQGEILAAEIFGATDLVEKAVQVAAYPSLEEVLASRAREILHDLLQQLAEASPPRR